MSGFSTDWLDLREPADMAARSKKVLDAVAGAFADRETVHVVDLACGSGSTLRALGPRLGARQRWTLVDHDEALLAHARVRLADWAETSAEEGDRLVLRRGGAVIEVETVAADLARDPLPKCAEGADLVAASALFDLVGVDWIDRFVGRLASQELPLYAALTYDGRTDFSPPDALDGDVVAAFNRHQTSDKGFGPALGPEAAAALRSAFSRLGYRTEAGDSPWRLGSAEAALAEELVRGMGEAVAELADAPEGVDGWAARRIAAARGGGVTVGHEDLFARPAGSLDRPR